MKQKKLKQDQEVVQQQAEVASPEIAQSEAVQTEPSEGRGEPGETSCVLEHDLVEQAKKETEELKDQLLRTLAEYENFRKRSQREKEQLYQDALSSIALQWLPLVDNLDRGLCAAEQVLKNDESEVLKGFEMIQKQAHQILDKLGIEIIEAQGQTFDPLLHHAVLQVEHEEAGEQEIIEVFETGYRLGEKVLRPSVVKVAN